MLKFSLHLSQNDLDLVFSSRSESPVPNKPCRVSGRLTSEYSSGEYRHYWTGCPAYVALQAQRSHVPKLFSYQMSSLRTLFPFRMLIAAIAALDSCDPCVDDEKLGSSSLAVGLFTRNVHPIPSSILSQHILESLN